MDLKELYRDVILDHNRQPRNFGRLEPADAKAEGHNPLCGDRLSLFVRLDGDRIADLRFEGKGCAISTASASLMTAVSVSSTSSNCGFRPDASSARRIVRHRILARRSLRQRTEQHHHYSGLSLRTVGVGARDYPPLAK